MYRLMIIIFVFISLFLNNFNLCYADSQCTKQNDEFVSLLASRTIIESCALKYEGNRPSIEFKEIDDFLKALESKMEYLVPSIGENAAKLMFEGMEIRTKSIRENISKENCIKSLSAYSEKYKSLGLNVSGINTLLMWLNVKK